jgi:hypothetical protein
MRVDLEMKKIEGVEIFRLNNRHVIGSANGGTGHIGSGTPAYVWLSGFYSLPDNLQQLVFLYQMQELPGISSPDNDYIRGFYHIGRALRFMDGNKIMACLFEAATDLFGVIIIGNCNTGVRDECAIQGLFTQKFTDVWTRIFQVFLPGIRGVAEKLQSHNKKA